ncbi:MAG: DUF3846 domain-containing protein [Ruminococcus sp.]|nr:DUF3846 domain-containing protein [Ruminococcus sp.]
MNKITAIKFTPDGEAIVTKIEDTLESLQAAVGGYIETITLSDDFVLICDEEGVLKGKPRNTLAEMFVGGLVGTVLVAGISGDEFADVPAGIIRYVADRLGGIMKEVK